MKSPFLQPTWTCLIPLTGGPTPESPEQNGLGAVVDCISITEKSKSDSILDLFFFPLIFELCGPEPFVEECCIEPQICRAAYSWGSCLWVHSHGDKKATEQRITSALLEVYKWPDLGGELQTVTTPLPHLALESYFSRLPWWLSGKESACQCRRRRFDSWSRKVPWSH